MQNTNESEHLLTTEDVANRLRVSRETLSTWRCTGAQEIPFVKVGRLVRYRSADVDAYLEGASRRHSVFDAIAREFERTKKVRTVGPKSS